jgi:DNA-binding HxlR family transcriptional regulator
MLSDRLAELTTAGMIARDVDAGPPVSVRYSLTASGCALTPALDLVRDWAQEHLLRPA